MKYSFLAPIVLFLLTNSLRAEGIRVGAVDIVPYSISTDTGLHVEWWRELERRTDLNLTVNLYPLARLRALLENNQVDLALYGEGEQQSADVVDVMPHQDINFVIYSAKNESLKLEGLKGLKVGSINGATGFRDLSEQYDFRQVRVASYTSLIKMYKAGRLDAIYGVDSAIEYYNAEMYIPPYKLDPPLKVHSVPTVVRVSKRFHDQFPEIIKKIQDTAAAMADEGWRSEVEKSYDSRF